MVKLVFNHLRSLLIVVMVVVVTSGCTEFPDNRSGTIEINDKDEIHWRADSGFCSRVSDPKDASSESNCTLFSSFGAQGQLPMDLCNNGKAFDTLNIQFCTEIQSGELRDLCYQGVAIALNSPKHCENIGAREIQKECYWDIASIWKDFRICLCVEDDADWHRRCSEEIEQIVTNELKLFGKEVTPPDPESYCDLITLEQLVRENQEVFHQTAINRVPEEYEEAIPLFEEYSETIDMSRDVCHMNNAIHTLEYKICEKIKDPVQQELCKNQVEESRTFLTLATEALSKNS